METEEEARAKFRVGMPDMHMSVVMHLLIAKTRGSGLYTKVINQAVTMEQARRWLIRPHDKLDGLAPLELINEDHAWIILMKWDEVKPEPAKPGEN